MLKKIYKSLFAFILRGTSAAAKLALIAYLSREGAVDLVGQLAIIYSLLGIFTQVAGLEVYQILARDVNSMPPEVRLRWVSAQAYLALSLYLILVPFFVGYAFNKGVVNIFLFGILLIFEHVLTELYRFNVAVLKPVKASLVMFSKNAFWVALYFALVEFSVFEISLKSIMLFWAFSVLAVASALLMPHFDVEFIKGYFNFAAWRSDAFSLVIRAKTFMLSALSMAILTSFDKLIASSVFSLNTLGVFFFFQTLASIPGLLINFSVGVTLWPQCVKMAVSGDIDGYKASLTKLKKLYLLIFLMASLLLVLMWHYFSAHFDPIYQSNDRMLYILLLASFLFSMAEPVKLKLYAQKQDVKLTIGNVLQSILVVSCACFSLLFEDVFIFGIGVLLGNMLSYFIFRSIRDSALLCGVR